MEKDLIKEKLANYRNTQTHIWTAMLVTVSGSLTLLQNFSFLLNKILFGLGVIFFIFFLNVYLDRNEIIAKLTRKLEELK